MSPSPRLWRMRCTEVMVSGGLLAVAAGIGAGLLAGPAVAVTAVAVVLLGSLAAAAVCSFTVARRNMRSMGPALTSTNCIRP